MEDWKECTIGDICSSVSETYSRKDENVVLINTSDVLEGKFLTHLEVPNKDLKGQFKKTFQRNDILYSEIRPANKRYAYVDFDKTANYIASTKLMVIRPNMTLVDPKYLFALLTSNELIDEMQHLAETRSGTFPQITFSSELSTYPVTLPPLPTQQKIAQILSSLDDKIELNNKINANLEQQAQALFKSWFEDFEPFGGEMPAGWKVGTIGDLCSTVSQTYKGNDSEVVLINTSDVENGDILNHESVANSNLKGQFKKTFQRNDILYSEIRPANRHYAFVDIDETCNYIASIKLMVIRPNEDVNPHYLYHILTNPDLIKEMQHLAETRSGTFPQITFESELSTYQIPLLQKEEQDKLGNLFEKIDNMVFHNIRENKKLSNLRNTLLPKLMNGEINIKKEGSTCLEDLIL